MKDETETNISYGANAFIGQSALVGHLATAYENLYLPPVRYTLYTCEAINSIIIL